MRTHFLHTCFWLLVGCGGFGPHADLVTSDAKPHAAPVTWTARITYLGTNGYLIESDAKRILVDPYFSRIGIGAAAINLPIACDTDLVDRYLEKLKIDDHSLDLIVVTHGHFDHLLDVPHIAKRTGAPVLASATSCHLLRAMGVRGKQTVPTEPDQNYKQGVLQVRTLTASHDTICCGAVPFPGKLTTTPPKPTAPSHYVLGQPLAFLVQLAGKKIYIDSGGTPATLPPDNLGPVDLAIVGVALPDSRTRLKQTLTRLKPSHFLPSHQDDFFAPLKSGFRYGPMTDPTHVRRIHESLNDDSHLLMLDYFQPWTLK